MKYLGVAGAVLFAAHAQARPVVVELFTSQACSSCPPADALLRTLHATDADILPLSFNVTYWNGPAWTDPYSLAAATDRQNWYVGLQHGDTVYTPEAVVDGGAQLVGSDRDGVTSAIAQAKAAQARAAQARAAPAGDVPVTVTATGGPDVAVAVGGGAAAAAKVWLFGYDSIHTTRVGGGENGGAALTEINVVRSITPLGGWSGAAQNFTAARPAGQHMAVLLQRDDGAIEGAGTD